MIEGGIVDQAIDTIIANNTASLSNLDESIEALIEAAFNIQQQYMDNFTEVSGRNGNKKGSRAPTVRARETNSGSKTLEIRWMRTTKTPDGKPLRKSFSKGNSASYSIGRIAKGAPEWEVALITAAEQEFTKIRANYIKLSKIRRAISDISTSLSQ